MISKIFKLKLLLTVLMVFFNVAIYADSFTKYANESKLDNLSIVYDEDEGLEHLYVNNLLVESTPTSPRLLSIIGKATLGTNRVYVIYAIKDGTVDFDTNMHYFFVTVDQKENVKVSKLTHEAYHDKINIESGLIKVTYRNSAPYAYESDLGVYVYDPASNSINSLKNVRWYGYYKKQFENYTPQHVIDVIKLDDCYNHDAYNQQNTLEFAHTCGRYGDKYCFMFKAIKNPAHDQYYKLLNNSCALNIESYR